MPPSAPSAVANRPRRRVVAGLLAGVVLIGALLLLAAGAGNPKDTPSPRPAVARRAPVLKLIWGPSTLPDGRSAFPLYRRIGVDVLERQLDWARVARSRPAHATDPRDPAYVWDPKLDLTLRESGRAGIDVALMVKETPWWANEGRGIAQAPDRDRDYADFLVAAARRYPSVHRWIIWGEPTRPGGFAPMPPGSPVGPRRYARLLDAAYAALKREDRDSVVIGGNTWSVGAVSAPDFIRWMRLPDGRPPRMDLFGHDPYSVRSPRLSRPVYAKGVRDISDIDTLHRELATAYAGRRVPRLWLAEFSIGTDHSSREFAFYADRPAQARWVTDAYRLVNRTDYVAGLGWYDLVDEAPPTATSLTNGLLDAAGKPKPGLGAYRRAP